MNIQIVKPQPGPQAAFIQCTADVVCYGGARGGGKSWAIALDFWLHGERHGEDARGLILRKTREDLKDFVDTAGRMYAGSARYSEKGNFFRFTTGAKLYCGYLEREADAANYQGWSLTRLYFDELTQLTTLDPVLRLLATLRSAKAIRPQAKFSCNPGGPSHHEVKSKFVDLGAYNVTWKDGLSWVFIPARVQDNPALLQADPRYIDRLKSTGSPQRVRAWLEGDWNVIEGAFFSEFSTRGTSSRRLRCRRTGRNSGRWTGGRHRPSPCIGWQLSRTTSNTMAAPFRAAHSSFTGSGTEQVHRTSA